MPHVRVAIAARERMQCAHAESMSISHRWVWRSVKLGDHPVEGLGHCRKTFHQGDHPYVRIPRLRSPGSHVLQNWTLLVNAFLHRPTVCLEVMSVMTSSCG